jgi:hypothetical protein
MEHLERIAIALAAGPMGYFFGGPGFAVHVVRAEASRDRELVRRAERGQPSVRRGLLGRDGEGPAAISSAKLPLS